MTLSNLCRLKQNKLLLVKMGILKPLYYTIQHPEMTELSKQYATNALMKLSDEDGLEVVLVRDGVIPPLMDMMRSEHTPEAQEFAIEALYNISCNPEMRVHVKAAGVTKEMIQWKEIW